MLSDTLEEIVNFRRSNRSFDTEIKVPADVIKRSFGRTILSPDSSKMQLLSFYWIIYEEA
jgi:nitroreductase